MWTGTILPSTTSSASGTSGGLRASQWDWVKRPRGVNSSLPRNWLYGAAAELSFGTDARASGPVVPSAFLGLGLMEGVALFEALVSPGMPGERYFEALRGTLTHEIASQVLRRVAGGVFPSLAWEAVYDRLGLEAVLDGTGSRQDRR